jgi:hypothetical protein
MKLFNVRFQAMIAFIVVSTIGFSVFITSCNKERAAISATELATNNSFKQLANLHVNVASKFLTSNKDSDNSKELDLLVNNSVELNEVQKSRLIKIIGFSDHDTFIQFAVVSDSLILDIDKSMPQIKNMAIDERNKLVNQAIAILFEQKEIAHTAGNNEVYLRNGCCAQCFSAEENCHRGAISQYFINAYGLGITMASAGASIAGPWGGFGGMLAGTGIALWNLNNNYASCHDVFTSCANTCGSCR